MSDSSADPCALSLPENYSAGIHVGAVFIILIASLVGSGAPLLAKRVPALAANPHAVVVGKHIGTGVLMALALVHLLVPALEALTNECLSTFWTSTYRSMAAVIALAAAFAMHAIDMLAPMIHAVSATMHREESVEDPPGAFCEAVSPGPCDVHAHGALLDKGASRSISAYILEFGLSAHSVIIGITVGVAANKELSTLLPALAFHQFFEGFGLGARLVDADLTPLLEAALAIVYSVSAPVGIAIGIGIHTSYNGNRTQTSITQGVFDSVSAGIILYISFVVMLGQEFPRDFHYSEGWTRKASLFVAMLAGAAVMAVIGTWL
jgi:solute carrier family 39 (zinc transporter), member 1/2/3